MYFKVSMRKNPDTGKLSGYYRLVESYRNETGRVCHRTIINVGFIDHVAAEQLNKIQKDLTSRAEGKISLFEETDEEVLQLSQSLWNRMISEKRVDLPEKVFEKRQRLVDIETIKHKDVREIGSEWLGFQAVKQLNIREFLQSLGGKNRRYSLPLPRL